MADYTIEIPWADNPTYEDVKKLYECFENIASRMLYKRISLHFNFQCGAMRYVVNSIEEFTETAFGETEFKLTALQFLAFLPDKNSVGINYLCGLTVSASSKVLLEALQKGLSFGVSFENQCKEQKNTTSREVALTTAPMNNVHSAMNSPITITGSGNIINVSAGSIDVNQTENEQKQEKPTRFISFISGVLQGVAGNAVWYILGVIGTVILGWFVFD